MSTGKKLAPLWFLIMIPAQLLIDFGIVYLCILGDESLFSNPNPDTLGHGIPVFTILGLGIAVFFTIIVLILSITLTVVNLVRRSKRAAAMEQQNAAAMEQQRVAAMEQQNAAAMEQQNVAAMEQQRAAAMEQQRTAQLQQQNIDSV